MAQARDTSLTPKSMGEEADDDKNTCNEKSSAPINPDGKCEKKSPDEGISSTKGVNKKQSKCSHSTTKAKSSEAAKKKICSEICNRPLPCGHECKRKCGDKCQNCKEMVSKIIDDCGHTVIIRCSKEPKKFHCTKKCTRVLSCGHKCTLKCKKDCSTSICKELVNIPDKKTACEHNLVVPCHLKDKHSTEDGLQHCIAPCKVRLICQDMCSGTCGKCYQGRLHISCTAKCNTSLLCGHKINTMCRYAHKPCSEPCGYKCEHSVCKEACGDPCIECKEKCARVCEHAACTKLCFEECSVAPCTEPCKKVLQCGHECIGYCGDKCPPLCRICDKTVVEEIKANEAARFVYFEECGHVLEGSAADKLFKIPQRTSRISCLTCPKCRITINYTQRYRTYIKAFLRDMQTIKLNSCRTIISQKDLILEYRRLSTTFPCAKPRLLNWIKDVERYPEDIVIYNAKVQILKEILFIYTAAKELESTMVINRAVVLLHVLRNISEISNQNIADFRLETRRLERMWQYCRIKNANENFINLVEYETCNSLLSSIHQRYSKKEDHTLKAALKAFNRKMETGFNISTPEPIKIEVPISMISLYWYKCRSGHIFIRRRCEDVCHQCE